MKSGQKKAYGKIQGLSRFGKKALVTLKRGIPLNILKGVNQRSKIMGIKFHKPTSLEKGMSGFFFEEITTNCLKKVSWHLLRKKEGGIITAE
ncbi:MAG: hypothetical protein CM1200mP28_06810 [Deltaproteobacteria bacterium]|nr:MAG: hypothetical protein CM1200mP28_06810 [Deltaproteobacteria bacterium]